MTECKFEWDEPDDCTTPRGWCHLTNHPDSPDPYNESRCVGNYCTYNFVGGTRGPNGEEVHACAYIFRYCNITRVQQTIGLGSAWFFGVSDAREFIESNVCAYFGLWRNPTHHGHLIVEV